MTYKNNFVAAIKVNGKILRDTNQEVLIPFGSEYSIYLKNLNSVSAIVSITIDGTDVTGEGIVLSPGAILDFERSLANNNLRSGNKFKFIARTEEIEEHRGIGAEDGLITITYKFAKNKPQNNYLGPNLPDYNFWCSETSYHNRGFLRSTNTVFANGMNTQTNDSASVADTGITVPGGISNQSFVSVPDFECGPAEVITIHLLGKTADKVTVKKAITVEHKPECISCGLKNRATHAFCNRCGTSLKLVK